MPKKEIKKQAGSPDEKINLQDIPELDFDALGRPLIGKFYRPTKELISIRMDADVLHWFRSHQHYQKLINKVCRLYMYQQINLAKQKNLKQARH